MPHGLIEFLAQKRHTFQILDLRSLIKLQDFLEMNTTHQKENL